MVLVDPRVLVLLSLVVLATTSLVVVPAAAVVVSATGFGFLDAFSSVSCLTSGLWTLTTTIVFGLVIVFLSGSLRSLLAILICSRGSSCALRLLASVVLARRLLGFFFRAHPSVWEVIDNCKVAVININLFNRACLSTI